jgi:DNA polymerase III subunit alpha
VTGRFWSIHTHARNSALDGAGRVIDHVARAAQLGYPALALTDHGTMAGTVELYRECRERKIKPLPGIEVYAAYGPKQRKVFHAGLVATSERGYINLVAINNHMMQSFYYKPILDLTKINRMNTTDVIFTSGCFFGVALSANRVDPSIPLNVLSTIAEYFDVYLEAQSHGIHTEDHNDDEDQLTVLSWAKELGLPMVLGQDSHYVMEHERNEHDDMKKIGSWSDDPDAAIFPGDHAYCLISHEQAQQRFHPAVFEAGMAGLDAIAEKADVRIPPLDEFNPIILTHPSDDQRIAKVFDHPCAQDEVYRDRLGAELSIIHEFNFTGYMLLVADIVHYLRSHDITYNIRGSAVGSLVCYALGISHLDPIWWSNHLGQNLTFDRFLSRNRAKLPDIDIDVDSERRAEVIEWLRGNYVVTSIGTSLELGVWVGDVEAKGSAVVKWKQYQRKIGKSEVVDEHTREMLQRMTAGGRVISGKSTHASGLVVAPDRESMKWMPLAVIGSKAGNDRFVTALDMDSVEAMGYIKVDLLGVSVLHAVGLCLKSTGMTLDQIPLDDRDVYAILGEGLTTGMFQLSGWTTRNGMKRMKPQNIGDIIAAMALFRPATMDSGATDRYLKRLQAKRRGSKPTYLEGLHPDIVKIIASTYGELLYQEQVIDALKSLGFTADELGKALKAIKASNASVGRAAEAIAKLKSSVSGRAKDRGWRSKDISWLESAFEAYANYGFNLAHATSYGLLAYRTAWLQYHYPGQFWQGMIAAHSKDAEKVIEYTNELAARNFVRMPQDVNTSGESMRVDIDRKRIYPSLSAIKGIGPEIAKAISSRAPFDSMSDFANRMVGTRVSGVSDLASGVAPEECSGAVRLLARAGAFRSLD